MPHVLKNNKPSTYIIKLSNNVDKFVIVDQRDKVYYYRYLPNGLKVLKVNIPDTGNYYFSANAEVKREPLQICSEVNRIKLPPEERNRSKDYFITHDNNLTDSPAIIYTETGHIVTGSKFRSLPIPMKIFILLHEIGHFKYHTEKFCDLYATIEFIKLGYNPSTAIYCLTDYLRSRPENDDRINYVYSEMKKAGIIK